MSETRAVLVRKGARRMGDVPPQVLADLAAGDAETVNLMEWLAVDMSALARAVASGSVSPVLRIALLDAASAMVGRGVTERLRLAGAAIARSVPNLAGDGFEQLAAHRSDLVRQWACYAANDPGIACSLQERLANTRRFAADPNMSVREAAWMAFRPHIAMNLDLALRCLEPVTRSEDPNLRRFAIEVTRPRSVWGAHLDQLKREPSLAASLLENTRADPARYVQLAVGNWLNDASKTRSDWVAIVCARWATEGCRHTDFIVRRGTRSMRRVASSTNSRGGLF